MREKKIKMNILGSNNNRSKSKHMIGESGNKKDNIDNMSRDKSNRTFRSIDRNKNNNDNKKNNNDNKKIKNNNNRNDNSIDNNNKNDNSYDKDNNDRYDRLNFV
jgi:hypothetical protein